MVRVDLQRGGVPMDTFIYFCYLFTECVFVGSFSGILRAYRPSSPGGYSPNHLLLEKQLNAPIIQLSIEHIVE